MLDFTQLELLVMGGVFLAVGLVVFLVISRTAAARRLTKQRLQQSSTESGVALGYYPDMVMGDMTPALAAQVPMSAEKKSDLQKDLLAAGYYRKTALIEYAAIRTLLTITPLILALVWALMVEREEMFTVIFIGVLGAMGGYSLPRLYLVVRGKMRARAIERALPVAVDMLVMCLSAGLNLLASIRRVRRELRLAHPVLAEELEIVRMQAELSNLQFALQQLGDRVPVPEVRNLSMILVQSERLGTDTSAALLEYSNNLRVNMRQRADAQANRTMFWMLFPTLLCLWIPAGIILIGPAILELGDFRRSQAGDFRNARETLSTINQERGGALQQPNQPVSGVDAASGEVAR